MIYCRCISNLTDTFHAAEGKFVPVSGLKAEALLTGQASNVLIGRKQLQGSQEIDSSSIPFNYPDYDEVQTVDDNATGAADEEHLDDELENPQICQNKTSTIFVGWDRKEELMAWCRPHLNVLIQNPCKQLLTAIGQQIDPASSNRRNSQSVLHDLWPQSMRELDKPKPKSRINKDGRCIVPAEST